MEFGGPNWINQNERPRLSIELPFQSKKNENAIGVPQKMAVIWKESTLKAPGNPTVRGFGGRVFFYDDENQPIKVDGEMIVYGFETDSGSTTADKKFVFQKDTLDGHYGETDMGHSYSFWVPWDKLGGERTSITLIPAFKSVDGKIVRGGQTINVLPGKSPAEPELKTTTYQGQDIQLTAGTDGGNVRQAAHSEKGDSGIRETTIRLPKHLGNRIGKLPSNLGELNKVTVKQSAIQVFDEQGRKTSDRNASQDESTNRSSQSESAEKKERKPFGMPASFN